MTNFDAGIPELLPSAIEAEMAVLGALIIDPDAIHRIEPELRPEDFYLGSHQTIYGAIAGMIEQGRPVDFITVAEALSSAGKLTEAGGREAIKNLIDRTITSANIDRYAVLIAEKAKRRAIIRYGMKAQQLGYQTELEIEAVVGAVEAGLFEIGNTSQGDETEAIADIVAEINEDLTNPEVLPPGTRCGFTDLDEMTKGFQGSDLVVVAGRPGSGKSSFADQVVHNMADASNRPCVIFSLEMHKKQIVHRSLAREASVDVGRIRTKQIASNEWEPLAVASRSVSERPIFINDNTALSVSQIRTHCRQIQATHGPLGCVMIDYLQLIENGGNPENKALEIAAITRSLKKLAKQLNTPVFLLSQLNRGVESRTNKRPMLSDLRASGSIEEDSDIVIMLYRDDYYDANSDDSGTIEVIVSKHRNGPLGTVKLLFEKEFTRFKNIDKLDSPAFPPRTTMHAVHTGGYGYE